MHPDNQVQSRDSCRFCGAITHASPNCGDLMMDPAEARTVALAALLDVEICTSLDAAQEIAHRTIEHIRRPRPSDAI